MIQLIIAFLISLGFQIKADQSDAVVINQTEGQNYGIVITDDVGTRTHITLVYDEVTKTFKIK